ncbi:MAG: hypothetical protein WCP97_00440 [bacterium]
MKGYYTIQELTEKYFSKLDKVEIENKLTYLRRLLKNNHHAVTGSFKEGSKFRGVWYIAEDCDYVAKLKE